VAYRRARLPRRPGAPLDAPAAPRQPAARRELRAIEARLGELFAGSAAEIRIARREFVFRYRSPIHWIEVFRTY